MKKLACVIAVAGLIGTPAFAAASAPVYSWTGFYIGGNMGGVLEHASGTSDFVDTGALIPSEATNPQPNAFSRGSFLGGAQIGYNWQFAPNWVFGVEGDLDWVDLHYSACRQTNISSAACFDNHQGFETIGSRTDWLATARGRLGVTTGKWFLYGTGGAAWGSVQPNLSLSCLVSGCGASSLALFASSSGSTIKAGWVAGVGVEWMMVSNWSVRGEWLHVDLGTITSTLLTIGTSGEGNQSAVWSRNEKYDEFRVGVNYLFR